MPNKKSVLFGTMITAGSAVGAGMFSLPIVSAGMWFSLALINFSIIWLISYLSALMILEVCLAYPIGASFDTFVTDILGKGWAIIMGLSVCFLLYILLYAYFSAFGNIAMHTLGWGETGAENFWLQGFLGFSLGMSLATIVWMSTAFVGRMATILVIGMAISFIISMSGTFATISITNLFATAPAGDNYFSYIWVGLPYFITSFGFSSIVPSLYKYYGKDLSSIKHSLFFGSFIALLVYTIWLGVTFGVIPRSDFVAINEAGGNVGHLVSALEQKIGSTTIQRAINLFSNFAIISSFLGVGLSLFDYIADRFKLADTNKGRFITAMITFFPAGLASLFFPNGFIAAIGYAGFVLYITFFLIPFLMIWKKRASNKATFYQLSGGKVTLLFVLTASTITAICKVLSLMKFLPTF